MMTSHDEKLDVGDDFQIVRTVRHAAGSGTWVRGTIAGYRFDALVFPEHAENADWENGDSRISKLWIQRLADKTAVYNWDRGADIQPADETAAQVVDFLVSGLADHIYL